MSVKSIKYVKYVGDHTLDLVPLTGKLLDIQSGKRGLRPDLENFHFVKLEIINNYSTAGKAAGIPEDVFDHFVMCNTTVESIDEKLVIARKQVEVLEESRAFYVDARQNDVALMVDSMKSRAQRRKDPSILAPFETTITYIGQIGDKAAKTRKKNAAMAEQEAASDEAPASDAEPTSDAEPASEQDMRMALQAYKAELEAKFNEAVATAVEKKLAEMQRSSAVAS